MTIVTQWINGEDVPGDGEALDIIKGAILAWFTF